MSREVVITGVGAVTPLGVGARTLHERWSAGVVGITDGKGVATEFDPTEHLSVKEVRRADRFTQFALVAGDEALAEAGWSEELPYEGDKIASILGTGIGGIGTLERGKEILIESGAKKVPPLSVPLMMSNAAAAAVSMRFKLLGPCHGIVSACSGGADAIGAAKMMIESGLVDAVVTGGSEAALTPLSNAAFGALDALSKQGISRPFDKDRDGFVMGEGGAILILETRENAEKRGAKILGTLKGYGASADAYHLTAPDKDGGGPSRAMKAAMLNAGITPDDIVYVNAHGTSTGLNDAAETKALKMALGDRAHEIPISSLKSSIGHLLGAAGAVEAVATILALRDRIAPPTLGLENPDEGLDLDYVPHQAKPLDIGDKPAIAISSSFGFGGHNAVLALEAA
ncbi:beta-ketoacyl-ACP synthase II [Solirubrobacter phytolaccae]|uniref:Beta-ketoacyl-ACP synthase II n=1 Tax=Solirubrobacter phytolaccae TaxID=1404360 RepID=A0A9X3NBV8_9ACTN|nr:beta-ketoacyl-ACP synthase II [Solirubrobacter phytolaccae]MDA0183224.1 beta-ketoacyl-ACP synthase II [Solirubrobacter phytolaccae]